MIGFGTLIILGVIIGSVSVSMFLFLDNLTVDVISESGERVKINDVEFDIRFVSYYEILEKTKEYMESEKALEIKGISTSEIPEGIYFQIQGIHFFFLKFHNLKQIVHQILYRQFVQALLILKLHQ